MDGKTRIRVLIATTRGPVEVLSIARENPSVRSVMCVGGSFTALPVSPAYDAFVREPTGVVERMTGHPVYRTDVGAPIESGESWQFGVFLAHVFHMSGILAKPEDSAEKTILVTGGLDRDLNVIPVAHVDRKLARAVAPEHGSSIFFYPEGVDLDEYADGWQCMPVSDVRKALHICLGEKAGERFLAQRAHSSQSESLRSQSQSFWSEIASKRGRSIAFIVAAAFAVVLLVVASASILFRGASTDRTNQQPARSATGLISLSVAPRDPDSGKCGRPILIAPDREVFDGAVCFGRMSVAQRGEYRIRMMIDGPFSTYVDRSRYRRVIQRTTDGGSSVVQQIDFPYWARERVILNAEAEVLGMDGNPVRSEKRSLEVNLAGRGVD